MRVMQVLADTTNAIAEGEVLQLMNCNDPDTTEARYMDVITRKTARLFEAGTRVGAIAAGAPAAAESALASYGLELGIAFQLADDALDYAADSAAMGKNVGDDLAEGKPTLPLIHVMAEGSDAQRTLVRKAIEDGGLDTIEDIQSAIHETGALEYTLKRARECAARARAALETLPESPYRDAMGALADFAVNRDH
jgi:octaprenyl-diphosphate synthase